MKHKNFIFIGAILALALSFGLTLYVNASSNDSAEASAEVIAAATGGDVALRYPSQFGFTTDTITDDEADTLTVSSPLLSNLQYSWAVTSTSLSGTDAVAIRVEESNTTSGTPTDWHVVGTNAIATDTTVTVQGASVYGVKQRIILTGSGTQSTQYKLSAVYKHNN